MKSHDRDEVLERNVATLIEAGGEAPRISDAARARIRAELIASAARDPAPARRRSPVRAIAFGLAATAAAGLIVTRIVGVGGDGGGEAPRRAGTYRSGDGTTWLAAPGGKVTVLGARRVRVEGAALLDVAPGKGRFVVETARGTIEVLGTRFLVDAGGDRTTAAVIRGQVVLASSAGEVVLHAGEQGVAEPGRAPTRGPAPRLSHLASWAAAARAELDPGARPIRNGTLFARDPNNPSVPESPLPLPNLTVDVVVEDQVARVAIDQTFHNPAPGVMEGVYRFAIPPDAALQRLAMYVDGVLTESGVVERMAARRIYEDVVYRRLDPALLEWAGTGRLALRVYPLPAREDKRLLLAYTQSLPRLYDDWSLTVPLPEVDLPVGEVKLGVRVKGCGACEISSPSHPVTVARDGDDAVVSHAAADARIGDSLVLRVRDPRRAPTVARHRDDGGAYVMVRARGELPRAPRAYRPRTWVILDDVSASRGALELRAQADLVDGFLGELDEDDRVAVVAFDVAARTRLGLTRVDDVDRQAVRTALAGEGGVGATDFGAALDAATALLAGVAPEDAMIVYVGDGVITSGARNLDALRARLAGKATFVGVGVGDGPDTQTLDALAAATGGYATTIDLADDVRWRAFDLVAALHTPRATGVEARLVDAAGAHVPATVYVRSAQLADGEELEVVAKLASSLAPAALELSGTVDGARWTQRVALDGARAGAGYLPRLWAQRHVAARMLAKHEPVIAPPCTDAAACPSEAELRSARDEAIRKEVVALGKRYFLLSRHTSLLVLENDAMYAKYGVAKGAGDTWAPYAVPARIAVRKVPVGPVTPATPAPTSAPDAELVRLPVPVFYPYDDLNLVFGGTAGPGWAGTGAGGGGAGFTVTREQARAEPRQRDPDAAGADTASAALDESKAERQAAEPSADVAREVAPASGPAPISPISTIPQGTSTSTGAGFGSGAGRAARIDSRWPYRYGRYGFVPTPARLAQPRDVAFDDLTGFIPALFPDASDTWRAELAAAAGGATSHPIDPAAAALLAEARRALPAGVYRWGERELAVDGARRVGWRRTTGADLGETASFDGTSWLRRYTELGIDVTRTLAEDDVAFALAHLPIWIAEPAHYARWFEVRATGPREVTLAGAAGVGFVLTFDDRHRLVSLARRGGAELVRVTWGPAGPTAAVVAGDEVEVGFTAQVVTDAVAWAHGASPAGVGVELPARQVAHWDGVLAARTPGEPAWRHAQRQRLVSLAASSDRPALVAAFEALRAHGGVELGDLVLASGGLAGVEAPLGALAGTPVGRYLAAARALHARPDARLEAPGAAGFVGALWSLREITGLLVGGGAQRAARAADRLAAFGGHAFDLRLVAAALVARHVRDPDVARVWDAVAVGAHRNVARAYAAQELASRGAWDLAADQVAALVAGLELRARPPQLGNAVYAFHQARRGAAGWQQVWTMWRDRVLAGDSYDHVMALFSIAHQHPGDAPAILARAAALAGDDPARVVAVAQLAHARGHGAIAQRLVEPLVKQRPTRELLQLAAAIARAQQRTGDALAYLEAAQGLGGDAPVALATLRAELAHILELARQLAVEAPDAAARRAAVERAHRWATHWRGLDPGHPDIDRTMGELLLAVGEHAEAWRQLSTVIERDPMSGDGYQTVAAVFERQGRVAEAIDYWQHALILDQTNPTPRLRKAQALMAVGRAAEGHALLAEIASRKWHIRHEGVVYQVRALLEQGRLQRPR